MKKTRYIAGSLVASLIAASMAAMPALAEEVTPPADYDQEVQQALATAEAADQSKYDESTWAAIQSARNLALLVQADGLADGNDHDAATVLSYVCGILKQEAPAGDVKVPAASKDLEDTNYQDVLTSLANAGFTNVTTTVQDDLVTGLLTKDGAVESVAIGGVTSFDASATFAANAEVVVTYHTFPSEEPKAEPQQIADADLTWLLSQQPVSISSLWYSEGDDRYPGLYPDSIVADITNTTGENISKISLAYVAWDGQGLPLTDFASWTSTGYSWKSDAVVLTDLDNANIVPGGTYSATIDIASDFCLGGIASYRAIVVSYETYEGTTWKNPLYDEWEKMYKGKLSSQIGTVSWDGTSI